MTTLPPELVDIIVHEIWYSDMPSYIRKSFMTTCPRINRMWKAVYAPIASRDMYITNLAFLDYLCAIAHRQKSIIYHNFIPQLTRTITCFIDLREDERETAVKKVYRYLFGLPNIRGFDALFPHIPYISFQLTWIGIGPDSRLQFLRGIPIRARYDRYLSNACSPDCPRWKTQMDVYIVMTDPDPSAAIPDSIWSDTLWELRDIGVPEFLFGIIASPGPYDMFVTDGVRHIGQTTYIAERKLEDYDPRNINKRLWMASKYHKRHTLALRCLTSLFHRWEYRRVQSPIPLITGNRYGVESLFKDSMYYGYRSPPACKRVNTCLHSAFSVFTRYFFLPSLFFLLILQWNIVES
ncbi:uncharacterized protein EV420DRAFT_1748482 [Desarmillaria tabescens]|uniref:Uncharacterized protein n=1 Tax=Armillaria tabescens TaxID=1929756 RepID=A0AA39N587_ARMTA|nr:uncharacterized protein EV420DRAFT_1748482 [Desarmillaria tabescens]KAK0457745.1 hypothetical protein EV420DRAFT_1748482 [Desarmillaria tabescens]